MPRPAPRLSGLLAALVLMLAGTMGTGLGTAAMAQALAPAPASVIYTIEQLRTGPLGPEIHQKLVPLHTMAEVETLLKANRIPFAWTIGDVGADKMPPGMASQIAALPPREV